MSSDTAPSGRHAQLSASPAHLSPRPRAVWCQAAGTFTAVDEGGASLDYTMTAGTVLPFKPVKVTAIASGTFYALY